MIGTPHFPADNPKFQRGDNVQFYYAGKRRTGIITARYSVGIYTRNQYTIKSEGFVYCIPEKEITA